MTRILAAYMLVFLLISCSSAPTGNVVQESTHLSPIIDETARQNVKLQTDLDTCTVAFNEAKIKVQETIEDIRKYDIIYEQKVDELRRCENELQGYKPAVVKSTGYQTISYDDLMRYSDDYIGQSVQYVGEVVQVMEAEDGTFELRVAVTKSEYGIYTDVIYVSYGGARVLEQDIVTVQGESVGLLSYETVMGNKITLPHVKADSILVDTKAGER